MPFIFKSRGTGILGKVYRTFLNLALRSKVIKAAVCHSSTELIYYRKAFAANGNKIFFIPYGQVAKYKISAKNVNNISKNPYFFSGGTSNRDYLTFAVCAEKTNFHFVIACTHNDIKGIKMPDNVKLFHDAYGEKFNFLLKQALAVILLFKDPNISSGQIVLLKAMQMGKPIIVTDSAGSRDYVDESCAFLVEHNNPEQLRKVLEYVISHPQEVKKRTTNAYMKYKREFTVGKFAFRVAELIAKNLKEVK